MIGKKILIVVAHPDDEVLGCGGTIRKAVFQGSKVHVLFFNNGCRHRKNFEPQRIANQIQCVADLLGYTWTALDYENNKMDMIPMSEASSKVIAMVKEFQPDHVMTHFDQDLHQDHKVVNQAVMIACRNMRNSPVKMVTEFPVISSSEVNPKFSFTPNLLVTVDEFIDLKVEAMACYEDELEAFVRLRGTHGIFGWGAFYGMHCESSFAEPFNVIRYVL
jgi:LmbE family N-acetylglucosaminyl deacetylase